MHPSACSPAIAHIYTTLDPSWKTDRVCTTKFVADSASEQKRETLFMQNSSNTSISQPLNNDIYRAGDIIEIRGTANGSAFQNYALQWGIGENPSEWFSTGVSLVNGGQIGIVNDTLAFWNTSFVLDGDFFTIRLTVNYTTNHSQALIQNIYLDPSLKQGWPQKINWEYFNEPPGGYIFAGLLEPVVCDVNNDGNMEIIVYMGGNPTKICVFNQNGSIVDGWPQEVDEEVLPGYNLDTPSVADIDNDGYKEIFVNGIAGIYVYRYNGSLLRFINLTYSSQPTTDTVLSDLNNDGSIEIIKEFDPDYYGPYYGNAEKIAVLDSDGTMLENWPQPYYNRTGPDNNSYEIWIIGAGSTPAVGNFDNDLEKEIVVVAPSNVFDDPAHPSETWHVEGSVTVFNLDGTVLPGFPVIIDGCPVSSPAAGDLNNDGYDEIILATTRFANPHSGLYVLDRLGKNVTGFPQLLGQSITTSPALADFNDDGFLEIVVSTIESPYRTYIFDSQGTVLPGWPQNTEWVDWRSPIVGDITGDTIPDIITTAGNGFIGGGVYAWTVNGSVIEGFPKHTEVDAQASVTIADIDSDGHLELIASSDWDMDIVHLDYKNRGSIYVWDLNGSVNSSTMDWPTFHHDNQRTGMYPLVSREVELGNITGGFFTVKATITNIGAVAANNINWNITATRFVLLGRKTTGSISALAPSDEQIITSKPLIGFGKTVIKIIVTFPGNTVSKEQNAVILLFVIIMK
jgi:hypothetical protein